MKKILIIAGVVVALAAIVTFTVFQSRKNVVEVQTGKVARQDLTSVVSASGEIKPLTFTNVGALAMGQIVKLYVKEGEWVKRGQLLAQVDNTQPGANVAAQRSALKAGETDARAADAGYLMTVADMSVITAEVRVDETDIINIKLGQPAEVTIDALPKQIFRGRVTEIGNNAMVRSTGVSTSQTTAGSQEAKDFKVVVTLDN